MALRHAVLAALLDGELSGYQLAKAFDVGVANFWHALPQQLYAELARLEREGLVAGRQVVQETRPTKRLFHVTDAGLAELERFAAAASKPSFIRDDLLVKVQAADHVDAGPLIRQVEERAAMAEAKIDLFRRILRKMRGGLGEEEFLRTGGRVGPYLTCLRGLAFEEGNRDWCLRIAAILRERSAAGPGGGSTAMTREGTARARGTRRWPMPSGERLRYVALGDSQTEGLGDGDPAHPRGWADRLAERLTAVDPEVTYANLAVRGRLAGEVRGEQLAPALALRPHLVTVVAGVNDLIRPRFDAAEVAGHLEAMFASLTAAGARVATLTFPDVGKIAPIARPLRSRVFQLNDRIRVAAARHGVVVAETASHAVSTDPRLWSADRLHASPLGHERIAAAVAHALGLPGSDDGWTLPLHPPVDPAGWRILGAELRWAGTFLGPWLVRRLLGRSSGDGRTAKRPALLPVRPTG